jgi:hypothetical protein
MALAPSGGNAMLGVIVVLIIFAGPRWLGRRYTRGI